MRNRERVRVGQLQRAAGALAAVAVLLGPQQARAQTVITGSNPLVIPSQRNPNDWFGVSVSVSDDVAVVGAPRRDTTTKSNPGAAYIYRSTSGSWAHEATLLPDRANNDEFGTSVAISGDTVVVGAHFYDVNITTNAGAAYVYRRDNVNGWQLPPEILTAPSPVSSARYGASVAISGDLVVVGAPIGQGLVYVYRDNGASCTLKATLSASSNAMFGAAVAVDGETIIVGAPAQGGGAVYIFQNTGTYESPAWTTTGALTPGTSYASGQFGFSVSIHETRAIVGSPNADVAAPDSGAAYIIENLTTVGPPIVPAFAAANDYFGYSVSIWETRAVVGADSANPNGITEAGQAHVFVLDGSTWEEQATLRASNAAAGDFFGYSVSAQENAIVGAYGNDDYRGAAYTFDLGPISPPDSDDDGLTDAEEVLLGTNPNAADTDGDSLTDGDEVLTHGTDPLDADTDTDGLDDGAEIYTHLTDPLDPDSDGDQLTDGAEVSTHGTDPLEADTDADGLDDGAEVNTHLTDPLDPDSDDDQLGDGAEVLTHGTNPHNEDTDGDTLTDGYEVSIQQFGCPSPTNHDSDGDGLTDDFELDFGLDPCDGDMDLDGLPDGLETQLGTDPFDTDTDDDGLWDGTEVDIANGGPCPSPLLADSDGDTISDGDEEAAGTSVCSADSDGDGANDAVDPFPNDPGVTSGFIEDWLRAASDDVLALDLSLFEGPNHNAARGRRLVTAITLRLAANATGREHYGLAILELQLLRSRLDGDPQPPDWMSPSPEQAQLLEDIDLLISWLGYEL